MYVKNEFNKCKDSESRAQWEKTGVHVFSIAETPPVLWKDSESRKQACMFFPLPRRLLSYGKIVKVERNGKKTGVHIFPHCRGAENRGGIEIGWSSEGHFVLWKLICYFASNIKR